MQQIESVLGEALGELYVAKYFSTDAKARALDVVERVRTALRRRLGEVVWMSDATRDRAIQVSALASFSHSDCCSLPSSSPHGPGEPGV